MKADCRYKDNVQIHDAMRKIYKEIDASAAIPLSTLHNYFISREAEPRTDESTRLLFVNRHFKLGL